jgi:hypothetical protein
MDAALMKLVKKHIIPEPELRRSLVYYARKKSAHHLVNEEYDQAADCDFAVDTLLAAMRDDGFAEDVAEQNHVLQERLATCKQCDRELNQNKKEMIERARSDLQQMVLNLEMKHEQQRTEFEARWSRPEARIPFAKPSVLLLQMRQQQKALALVHDFRTAKALKQQADALEKQEGLEATRRYEIALKVAWEQMVEEQLKEKQCLLENRDYELVVRTTEKEKMIASNDLTRQSLELRLAEPKHIKRPIIHVPAPKGPGRPSTAMGPKPTYALISQRTRSRLLSYRRSPDRQRLDLSPGEPKSIVKAASLRSP